MWAPDSKSTGELTYGVVIRLTDFPAITYSVDLGDHKDDLQRRPYINENKHNLENYWKEFRTLYHEWDLPGKDYFAGVNNLCAKTKSENGIEEKERKNKRRRRCDNTKESQQDKGREVKWQSETQGKKKWWVATLWYHVME